MLDFEVLPESAIDWEQVIGGHPVLVVPYPHDLQKPKRATKGSAGYDIVSPTDYCLNPNEVVILPTFLTVKLSPGIFLDIRPRSGSGSKGLRILNTTGVIDTDYYPGHIVLPLRNEGTQLITLTKNKGVVQGIFSIYLLTDDDSPLNAERSGGFGSTT